VPRKKKKNAMREDNGGNKGGQHGCRAHSAERNPLNHEGKERLGGSDLRRFRGVSMGKGEVFLSETVFFSETTS